MDTNQLSDPRQLFAAAVAVATPVIDGTQPGQYHLPTPCGEYDVEGLLGHLLLVVRRVASVSEGTADFSGEGVETSADWSADWRTGAENVTLAWADDARLDAEVVLPWATMTGSETLQMWSSELTTHTWDLARATGQQPAWNDEVCQAALESIKRDLPMADRTPMWESFVDQMPAGEPFTPPFGNAVPVADDASVIDQLVAWTGRHPAA